MQDKKTIKAIVLLYFLDFTQSQIAKMFKLNQSTISRILKKNQYYNFRIEQPLKISYIGSSADLEHIASKIGYYD